MGRFDREDRGERVSASLDSATEDLRSTVERQVREIVESAEARATAIEERALEKARQIERESERRASELLQASVDRAEKMLDGVQSVERYISQVVDSLRAEAFVTDPNVGTLVPAPTREAQSNGLVREASEESGVGPQLEPIVPGKKVNDREVITESDAPEGSPQVREMIRQQLVSLAESGRSRDDAERMLMRFRQGEQYRDLLDEVYNGRIEQPAESPRRSFLRRRKASPTS